MSVRFRQVTRAVRVCLEHGALGARVNGGGFGVLSWHLPRPNAWREAAQAVATSYAVHGYAAPRSLPMTAGFAASHDWSAATDMTDRKLMLAEVPLFTVSAPLDLKEGEPRCARAGSDDSFGR